MMKHLTVLHLHEGMSSLRNSESFHFLGSLWDPNTISPRSTLTLNEHHFSNDSDASRLHRIVDPCLACAPPPLPDPAQPPRAATSPEASRTSPHPCSGACPDPTPAWLPQPTASSLTPVAREGHLCLMPG